MTEKAPTSESSTERAPRRMRRLLGVPAVLALGALVLFVLRSSLLGGTLVDALEDELRVRARFGDCALSPTFDAISIEAVELRDLDGNLVLSCGSLDLAFRPLELLRREGRAEARAEALEVVLWRTADGAWNWSELGRQEPTSDAPSRGSGESESAESRESDLEFVVALRGVHVAEVAGPGSPEVLRSWRGDLEAELRLTEDAAGVRRAELRSLELDSDALRGSLAASVDLGSGDGPATLESSSAEFVLAPHELANLAGVDPPTQLDADARPRLRLALAGPVDGADAHAVARGLTGTAELDLEGLTLAGLELAGTLALEQREEQVHADGDFTASGGTITLQALVHPYPTESAPPSTLVLDAVDVPVTEEGRQLFGFVHPALATLDDLEDATVRGRTDAHVELSWAAPVPWAALADDPSTVDLAPLTGTGTLAVNDVVVQGSELLERMRRELDDDPDGELRLRELRFTLADGRLRYDRPWTWTIGGTETRFSGSVGLDRTLDLSWNVPVTARLVDEYRFLRKLEGQRLEVPLTGTASDPRIEFSGLVNQVAGSLLEQVLPGAAAEEGEGPEELLARADQLWAAKAYEEAAALYARLRSEHKLSLVYALNRSRVKERAAWRPAEPPD